MFQIPCIVVAERTVFYVALAAALHSNVVRKIYLKGVFGNRKLAEN